MVKIIIILIRCSYAFIFSRQCISGFLWTTYLIRPVLQIWPSLWRLWLIREKKSSIMDRTCVYILASTIPSPLQLNPARGVEVRSIFTYDGGGQRGEGGTEWGYTFCDLTLSFFFTFKDRVLFKSHEAAGIVGLTYDCCHSLKCSDHRYLKQ